MQAVAVNQRQEQFRDRRVRQAIGLCFDFEWTKRNLFYGSYERSQSCFEHSDYRAEGTPSPEELALLEPLRGKIPDEAFGEAVRSLSPMARAATASCSARRPNCLPKPDGTGRARSWSTRRANGCGRVSWSMTRPSCASARPGSRT